MRGHQTDEASHRETHANRPVFVFVATLFSCSWKPLGGPNSENPEAQMGTDKHRGGSFSSVESIRGHHEHSDGLMAQASHE